MKFDQLRALGHNIADSLASGVGIMAGAYGMDVYGDAGQSPDGFVEIDFLSGQVSSGKASPKLAQAAGLYGEALAGFCNRHGTTPDVFRELRARYYGSGRRFTVMVEDRLGRRATDAYEGLPGRRVRQLDVMGRARTNRHPLSST